MNTNETVGELIERMKQAIVRIKAKRQDQTGLDDFRLVVESQYSDSEFKITFQGYTSNTGSLYGDTLEEVEAAILAFDPKQKQREKLDELKKQAAALEAELAEPKV